MAGRRKMLVEMIVYRRFIMVTVLPSLSAVGSWEKVLLFSMEFTVFQNFLELGLQDANICFKKLAFAFRTDCVYWGLFDANAVHTTGCAGQGQSSQE